MCVSSGVYLQARARLLVCTSTWATRACMLRVCRETAGTPDPSAPRALFFTIPLETTVHVAEPATRGCTTFLQHQQMNATRTY